VSVYVPKTLTKEEKATIEQFRASDNFKGDADTKRSIFQKFKNYFS
jgi:molecular chaperone DnaJ